MAGVKFQYIQTIQGRIRRAYNWGRKNPFYLFGVMFLIYWLVPIFSRENSIYNQIQTQVQLHSLRREKKKLEEYIHKARKESEELQYHKDILEKYARERFLMKAENEDLFLLEKE